MDYYYDSPTRRQRRIRILQQLVDLFLKDENYLLTYAEICLALKIERRSLYRYYPTKNDILLDVAYLVVLDNNYAYINAVRKIFEERDNKQSILSDSLIVVSDIMIENKNRIKFLSNFDEQYHYMDESEKVRYKHLITGFKNENHYLQPVYTHLSNKGKIKHNEVAQLIEVTEQALNSFVSRTIEKMDESNRYTTDNIVKFISIIERGIIG